MVEYLLHQFSGRLAYDMDSMLVCKKEVLRFRGIKIPSSVSLMIDVAKVRTDLSCTEVEQNP